MPTWPVTNRFNPPTEPGIDYGTPIGTPIYSPISGTAQIADTGRQGWGKSVQVKPGNGKGVMTYGAGHLDNFGVRSGQTVTKGQLLGYTGNSGNSTGPHVEIFVKNVLGQFINPAPYADAFFTAAPLQTGNNSFSVPNPLDAIGQGFSDLGKNVSAAETDLVTKLVSTGEIILGVLLMLAGVALLALMVAKGAEPAVSAAKGAAQRFTPAGRVAGAVASPRPAPVAPSASAAPAAKPLSNEAQASVAAARAGRGSRLSPSVKAELRAREAA